jgi:uncharacterized protein (TIGR03435 family)
MDEYRADQEPLAFTIILAYFPMAYERRALESKDYLVGAPSWVWNDSYDFRAKVAPADLASWQEQRARLTAMAPSKLMQSMLQAALAERCRLVVHQVPGETDGFALVLEKHGPNNKALQMSRVGDEVPETAQPITGGGWMVPITPGGKESLTFFRTSMSALAAEFSFLEGVSVEDRTGLDGKYNFALARWQAEGDFGWDWGALGLKLERIRVPTELVVIDHIDKPTPD